MSVAVFMGKFGIILLLATAGALGLREFLKLIGWQVLGTPTVIVLFASVLIYYVFVWFGFGDLVRWMAPIVFQDHAMANPIRSCEPATRLFDLALPNRDASGNHHQS